MFARTFLTTARGRRGVVLVVILGMLGLLALVGVTFATFSGQSQISARNFAQGAKFPDVNTVVDFGIQQLINDTDNPLSALRGHSLKRDMYGNDSFFQIKSALTNPPQVTDVESNGYLVSMPTPFGALMLLGSRPKPTNTPFQNQLQVVTNIPVGGVIPGLTAGGFDANFTRWYLKIGPWQLPDPANPTHTIFYGAQTFEVLEDDRSGLDPFCAATDPTSGYQGNMHLLTLSPLDGYQAGQTLLPTATPAFGLTTIFNNHTFNYQGYASFSSLASIPFSATAQPFNGQPQPPIPFILDGRYRRAFNGTGLASLVSTSALATANTSLGAYANFRLNGTLMPYPSWDATFPNLGNPDMIPMDEDYDAVDLDNWFLALQSASGDVVVPSFHRPGILRADLTDSTYPNNAISTTATNDWRNTSVDSAARFLRPRYADGNSILSFPDLIPNAKGVINYDVDNDGDGTNDSVWMDLGYPAMRDGTGRLYKPMFSFMVLGLNGRMPLNTVGNIQGRFGLMSMGTLDMTGYPTWDHTSHLGNSVNEINPKFALQNAPDLANGVFSLISSQVDNPDLNNAPKTSLATTQLRNILAGTRPQSNPFSPANDNGDLNYVYMNVGGAGVKYYIPNSMTDPADAAAMGSAVTRNTTPVPGRWGEVEGIPALLNTTFPWPIYQDLVRAGTSPFSLPFDGTDDDFDTLDFYPLPSNTFSQESSDLWDIAGGMVLPSERMRRWVTPSDPVGTGVMVPWGPNPGTPQVAPNPPTFFTAQGGGYPDSSFGYDSLGRVGFWGYFRPPGLPMVANANPNPATAGSMIPTTDSMVGPSFGTAIDQTNNPLHGFDMYRIPTGSGSQTGTPTALNSTSPFTAFYGVMPFDSNVQPTFQAPQVPTFTPTPAVPSAAGINSSNNPTSPLFNTAQSPIAQDGWPFGSLNRDEADEMNLYASTPFDMPYGVSDLEWLYRKHDVDGVSLNSRLASLAPVSFLNPTDGLMRRRLFSTDSWEPTNFVWAHDNPGGTAFPTAAGASRFPGFNDPNIPASFLLNPWLGNASVENLYIINNLANSSTPGNVAQLQNQSPSIAHRERKINLNFPLPPSNSPFEPVRQKWIRESYQLLKQILPPKAVDTSQELLQLTQFLINIVDFRDTDSTCTIFTNTDPAIGATPVTQYGMEYCPIAINEVMAYTFLYKNLGANSANKRMYVELVNMLTKATDAGALNTQAPSISDLNLANWEFIVLPDTASVGQPDPTTGQIPGGMAAWPFDATRSLGSATANPTLSSLLAGDAGPEHNANINNATNHYYVFANASTAGTTAEPVPLAAPPTGNPAWAILPQAVVDGVGGGGTGGNTQDGLRPNYTTVPTSTSYPSNGGWYWLYLRRPANPLLPPQTNIANANYNPMVVVDSFRFPYIDGTVQRWKQLPNSTEYVPDPTGPANTLYSVQRLQPFRGGHAITGDDTHTPPFVYGYTEQTTPPQNTFSQGSTGGGQLLGRYTDSQNNTYNVTNPLGVYHTLGAGNNPDDDYWDYFPFHDRDFTSVAELLLVPGCPNGLFTKQFIEKVATSNGSPPYTPNGPAWTPISSPLTTSAPINATGFKWGKAFNNPATPPVQPRTFPYLPDEFYYTAATDATDTGRVGGIASAGWYKMLEAFEVPSSAIGAIGPVATGVNFDWMRQDLKPGLLNLNLIIDQEVFLGLIDDPRVNWGIVPTIDSQSRPQAILPHIVTQSDPTGYPTFSYPMSSRPMFYELGNNPALGGPVFMPVLGMPAAFSDFLKLRHGGSGYLFAWQNGAVGGGSRYLVSINPNIPAAARAVAAERPFHSLSFPDIDYTVMRPAALPPSPLTVDFGGNALVPNAGVGVTWPYVGDPGVKNPNFTPNSSGTVGTTPAYIPPIPPRRLLQIPDAFGSSGGGPPASNASEPGDPVVNSQVADPDLTNPLADLVMPVSPAALAAVPNVPVNAPFLGFNPPDLTPTPNRYDMRQHPYYRTEWLQKVINQTTVRTNQFAVWLTVGFFEVTVQGNPALAIPDQLGQELGKATGDNKRYRAFFVVDRTKATGFFIPFPGLGSNDYHDCVLFRRIIQ